MIFNLFGKKKQAESNSAITDCVFISNQGKINALMELAKQPSNTIFIGWFADSVTALRQLFIENGLNENSIVEAKHLHISIINGHQPVLIEHHPILQKELDLLEKFHISKVSVYSSLEEPLFKSFGSDKIISMTKLLGMKEDELIVHPLVSSSIARAQQKIAEKVLVEQTANSQEEWLLRNFNQ
jgi:hypothetical protein